MASSGLSNRMHCSLVRRFSLTSHNGPAELTRFTEDGGCVVTYRVGDDFAERKYIECYSKTKGSARLRRVPPSLTPPPRATSGLSTSDSTCKVILDHFSTACPTSPSTRDVMRRRVGPFVVQEKVSSGARPKPKPGARLKPFVTACDSMCSIS
eukprot:3098154-Prymnesium_polylepis.3